jgi:hypothetical protein
VQIKEALKRIEDREAMMTPATAAALPQQGGWTNWSALLSFWMDDFATFRLALMTLLPQVGGFVLMVVRR